MVILWAIRFESLPERTPDVFSCMTKGQISVCVFVCPSVMRAGCRMYCSCFLKAFRAVSETLEQAFVSGCLRFIIYKVKLISGVSSGPERCRKRFFFIFIIKHLVLWYKRCTFAHAFVKTEAKRERVLWKDYIRQRSSTRSVSAGRPAGTGKRNKSSIFFDRSLNRF